MIKEIIQIISSMSVKNGFSEYQIFTDWIQCTALAIQNTSCMFKDELHFDEDGLWRKREKDYLDIYDKYKDNRFPELTGLLVIELGENISDVLGHVYMASGMGSKSAGQFFTPFHLSYLTAATAFNPASYKGEIITMNEPSIGGGGMVLATAKVLQDHGYNYQTKLRVIGQDLDWKGVYMSYVQLSLLGIDAIIAQGDTLSEPYNKNFPKERVFRTPKNMGVLI